MIGALLGPHRSTDRRRRPVHARRRRNLPLPYTGAGIRRPIPTKKRDPYPNAPTDESAALLTQPWFSPCSARGASARLRAKKEPRSDQTVDRRRQIHEEQQPPTPNLQQQATDGRARRQAAPVACQREYRETVGVEASGRPKSASRPIGATSVNRYDRATHSTCPTDPPKSAPIAGNAGETMLSSSWPMNAPIQTCERPAMAPAAIPPPTPAGPVPAGTRCLDPPPRGRGPGGSGVPPPLTVPGHPRNPDPRPGRSRAPSGPATRVP